MKIVILISLILVSLIGTGVVFVWDDYFAAANTDGEFRLPPHVAPEGPSERNIQKWKAPVFMKIRVGESTAEEVKRIFGKPYWMGPPEEKTFEDESEGEIEMEYHDVPEVNSNIVFTIGRKSGIVKAIVMYPNFVQTEANIISEFGNEYVEISADESLCTVSRSNEAKPLSADSKRVFIYPQFGMYVLISEEDKVIHVGYLYRCIEGSDRP